MRFIGVRSHRSSNHRVGFVVATGIAIIAMLGLAGVGVAASGPVLTKSGPAMSLANDPAIRDAYMGLS